MSNEKQILIVEDDEAIATGLSLNLKIAGYAPSVVGDGDEALRAIEEDTPSLVLLDINLPHRNGIEVLTEVRRKGNRTPIIVLSARDSEFDKVAALRIGADDYVTKPFALAELLARIDAVLRRVSAHPVPPPAAHAEGFNDIEIDSDTRRVTRSGDEVKLTHLEFELLSFFVRNPNRVFSRDELLREVWQQRSGSKRTVDNFLAQLRSKLESDAENPQHFITVRGSGYRFDP
jgi:DNA-binding response OmpR family regulator